MNLDWSTIDDTKLQRLINDLICLQVNRMHFMHSNPEIGKDKGLDGWYEGNYPSIGINDNFKFSIQSKWVNDRTPKNTFTKLKAYLLGTSKKKGEITKAEENKANYLIIATNGNLNIEDHKKELTKLAENTNLKGIIVWDSEDLRSIIDLYPYLGFVYFQNPQYPSLVPPSSYFFSAEEHLLNIETPVNFRDFTSELSQVQKYIDSNKQILVVHAPGGYGKSHFLNLLSKGNIELNDKWHIWSCKLDHRAISDVIDEETNVSENYIFLIDDVDRSLTAILPLFRLIASGQKNIKIILSSRTAGILTLREALAANQLSAKYEEIDLTNWKQDELKTLFKSVSGETNESKIDVIIRQYVIPYLLVDIAKSIKKRGSFNGDVVLRIYDNLLLEISTGLPTTIINSETLKTLVVNLALITPFSSSDESIISKLSDACGLETKLIKKCLEILLEIKALRLISGNYRFNPDLKGDIFLAKYLETSSSTEIKDILLFWLGTNPVRVFNNLNSAFNHGKSNNVIGIVGAFIDELATKIHENTYQSNEYVFEICKSLSDIIPEKSLELFNTILDSSLTLRTDSTGPVLLSLGNTSLPFESICDLLIKIIQTNKEGTYDNYKFKNLVKSLVTPSYNSFARINEALDQSQKWISQEGLDNTKLDIIESILTCLLAISFEYSETWGLTMTFGSWALQDSKEALNYRKKAIEILKKLYLIDVQRAIKVIDSVGDTSRIGGGIPILPLEKIAQNEQKELIEFIKDNKPTLNLHEKVKFETFLIHWWAQEKGGEDVAESILREFPRETDYIILRSMTEFEAIITDFDTFKSKDLSEQAQERKDKNSGTSDSRWTWYVYSRMDRDEDKDIILKDVSVELNEKYKNESSIIEYLNRLNELFKSTSALTSNNRFLQLWVESYPVTFNLILLGRLLEIPELFRTTIVFSLLNVIENPKDIVQSILDNPNYYIAGELEAAIAKASSLYPSKDFTLKLLHVIKTTKREKLSGLIWAIARVEEKLEPNDFSLIIEVILSRIDVITTSELDNLDMLFRRKKDNAVAISKKSRSLLRSLLLKYPKSSYHLDQLTAYVILDITDVIRFIQNRLNTQEELSYLKYPTKLHRLHKLTGLIRRKYFNWKYSKLESAYQNYESEYDAIDIDGFPKLAEYVKNYDAYRKLINVLLDWDLQQKYFSWDIDKLASQIVMKEEFYKKFIEDLQAEKDSKRLLHFLDFLPITVTYPILIPSLEKVLISDPSQEDTIKSILGGKTLPKGGWSSAPGEAPPQFLELKDTFNLCLGLTSNPKMQIFLKECIKHIEKRIQSHISDDEEFLTPR